VSVPAAILPDLVAHLAKHTQPGPNALVFTGVKDGPLRRSGFNKLSGWPHVVTGMGLPGLHFHDLRHEGNTLAADMGVSLRNLMARRATTTNGPRSSTSTSPAPPTARSQTAWMRCSGSRRPRAAATMMGRQPP